jgi:RNase P/RNase MRP subunit p30
MFADIVMPNGNEEEFISLAERLGYSCLVFLYASQKKTDELQKKTKMKLISGVIADARKQIVANDCLFFVKADKDARSIFENKTIDVVFGLEATMGKDSFHQRNSGLNHVTALLAFENNIAVAFNLSEIINSDRREMLIGRIAQNIKLCRKFKAGAIIASFAAEPFQMRAPIDVKSFFEVIGMNPGEAKKALSCVHDRFIEKKNQHRIIKKGIEIVE